MSEGMEVTVLRVLQVDEFICNSVSEENSRANGEGYRCYGYLTIPYIEDKYLKNK